MTPADLQAIDVQIDRRRGLFNPIRPMATPTDLTARVHYRMKQIKARIREALESRGHHVAPEFVVDGIPAHLQIVPADLNGRWAPTDRTRIEIGNLVLGHIWWATEPATGWDLGLICDQVEAFMKVQLQKAGKPE